MLFKVCKKQFVSNMLINFHELNISVLGNFCFSFLQFFQHYYTLKSSKIPAFSMLTGGHLKNVGSTQNVTSFSLLLSLFLQGIISSLFDISIYRVALMYFLAELSTDKS